MLPKSINQKTTPPAHTPPHYYGGDVDMFRPELSKQEESSKFNDSVIGEPMNSQQMGEINNDRGKIFSQEGGVDSRPCRTGTNFFNDKAPAILSNRGDGSGLGPLSLHLREEV